MSMFVYPLFAHGHPSEGLPRLTAEHFEAARRFIDETPDRLVADVLLHMVAFQEIQSKTNLFSRDI